MHQYTSTRSSIRGRNEESCGESEANIFVDFIIETITSPHHKPSTIPAQHACKYKYTDTYILNPPALTTQDLYFIP